MKYILFFSDFNEISNTSTGFKNPQKTSKFTKIRPVGAEFCSRRTDGQRDMINLTVTFRSSAERLTFGTTTSYGRNFFNFSGYCL